MNAPPDPIDKLLMENERNTHVDDEGFTKRVMQKLPRKRRRFYWRRAILLLALVPGVILVACWFPWNLLTPAVAVGSVSVVSDSHVLLPWISIAAVMAAVAWGFCTAILREE
jgi:uncharacterized membrane protein (DUF485 family)